MIVTDKPYLIAETAYLHQGDLAYLKKMIKAASKAKADAIKFHALFDIDDYMTSTHPIYDSLKTWMFTKDEWDDIVEEPHENGLDVIMLCDDIKSLEHFSKSKLISGIELHATSINDIFMLKALLKFKGLAILGIGGCSIDEIDYAVSTLKGGGKNDILLMFGYQNYPTDYNKIYLSRMLKLKEYFNLPIGYADHTEYNDKNNEIISTLPVLFGCNVLEKHFTLKKGDERLDFHSAVGPEQLTTIKQLMGLFYSVAGHDKRTIAVEEQQYGIIGPNKKAIVAKHDLKKGQTIKLDDLWYKRTHEESHVEQRHLPKILGKKLGRAVHRNELIDFGHLEKVQDKKKKKDFLHVKDK
jgi:N,N'-diacetyllegionaminate synthase